MFLGAIIGGVIDGSYILKVRQGYFVTQEQSLLFGILHKLAEENNNYIDFISIVGELNPKLGQIKSTNLLQSLVAKVPQEFNPQKAIQLLDNHFIQRETTRLFDEAKIRCYDHPEQAPEITLSIYEQLDKLSETTVEYDIKKEFQSTIDDLLTNDTNKVFVKTGFKSIDHLIGGYPKQEVTIIGARPGHGKTSYSVAAGFAVLDANPNAKVVIFQCEMSKEQYKRKMLANQSSVSSYRMLTGELKEGDFDKLQAGLVKLDKYAGRLFIYDNVMDIHSMNKICRSVKADAAFIDFITEMDDVDDNNLRITLGRVMRTAKRFAKAHEMAYIIFSQLKRPNALLEKLPCQDDLAESDLLTQLAATIILLYYRFKSSQDPKDKNKLLFLFDKTRFSSISESALYADMDYVQLKDLK
jgi:replicative DNA helicase